MIKIFYIEKQINNCKIYKKYYFKSLSKKQKQHLNPKQLIILNNIEKYENQKEFENNENLKIN